MSPIDRARAARERGQVLLLFVAAFSIIALMATITVDFGLWFSERRGAQKDADLASLAGAYELLDETSIAGDAIDAAEDNATANGLNPGEDLHDLDVKSLEFPDGFEDDPEYCHTASSIVGGRPNAVVLDADHDTSALFANVYRGLVGLGPGSAPEVGAHACARAGSLRSTTGLRPWVISMYNTPCFDRVDDGDTVPDADDEFIPQFMQECVFRLDNPSQVGSIRLGADEADTECSPPGGGAAEYKENIIEGADAWCSIDDIVVTQPGLDQGPTKQALTDLLALEGECDAENGSPPDGIDDFEESFDPTSGIPGPDVTFTPKDCTTPRAISIVIVDEFDTLGQDSRPIEGFAAFFLEGCWTVDGNGTRIEFYPKCDMRSTSWEIVGFFMQVLELEGDVGDFDTFGTKAIRLVE